MREKYYSSLTATKQWSFSFFISLRKGRMVLDLKHSTTSNYKEDPQGDENYKAGHRELLCHLPQREPTTGVHGPFLTLQDFSSHRIFKRMHDILNVAKQNY